MSMEPVIIALTPAQFGEREAILAECGEFTATAFRFESGVCALRLMNAVGSATVLPWQGQQIWSAHFHGRELTMKSMFEQPQPHASYLETYGAFLLHCGATAMGVPGPEDTHPLHGELPNAPYQGAYLELGEDEDGGYIAIGGWYRHTVAFTCNYTAEPLIKLRAESGLMDVTMDITNHKVTPMEWMYLAHINFRPVDQARLVYSAPCDPDHVRVRTSIPPHVRPPAGYREFLAELAEDPGMHNVFSDELSYDPEVCFFLDYEADAEGWAHTLQVLPEGGADYVGHRPEQLDKVIRWIASNGDQGAMGMALPATAEPEGYAAEKAKGHILTLGPGHTTRIELRAGALTPEQAAEKTAAVASILG
ncbi:MAG: DUF4432 family protein [Victivallales bacterium]|nr:DUF4432 family protein [Victivallales bacterium]